MSRQVRNTAVLLVTLALAACIKSGDIKEDTSSPAEAARINYQMGVEYFRKGNLTLAYDKLKRSVSQDAGNAQTHAFLALVSEQLDLMDDAKKHYRAALRIDDKDPAVQNMYGAYLCRTGKAREAEAHFLSAANNRFYSTPEAAYTNAGSCALKINDVVKADTYLRKALTYDPAYALALWHLAKLNYEQDRDLQARAFLDRIGTPDVLPPEALLLGYQIATRSGRSADARHYGQNLKTRYPDSAETTQLLEMEKHGG